MSIRPRPGGVLVGPGGGNHRKGLDRQSTTTSSGDIHLKLDPKLFIERQSRHFVADFVCAAREGRVDAVRKYLDSDYFRRRKGHTNSTPPIDRLDQDGVGALHYASRYNHKPVMELLLERGADVNSKGADDLTPLHFAARYAPRGTALDSAAVYYVPFKPTVARPLSAHGHYINTCTGFANVCVRHHPKIHLNCTNTAATPSPPQSS
eukprot:sb/3470376/